MMTTEDALSSCEGYARAAFAASGDRRTRDVALYLAHVGAGVTMRALARARGRQPSTVMRAIRRIEALRDDPLLERALTTLEEEAFSLSRSIVKKDTPMQTDSARPSRRGPRLPDSERAALERLAEPDSFLLVANGAEKAGVFTSQNGFRKPVALVPVAAATRFLTKDWVNSVSRTDISARYAMTATGSAMLRRREVAEDPNPNPGFAEAPSVFSGQHQMAGERRVANPVTGEIETIRVNLGESPLGWLARRKDGNGFSLLSAEEVEAGERLREDFEMAQIGPKVAQDWSLRRDNQDETSATIRMRARGRLRTEGRA